MLPMAAKYVCMPGRSYCGKPPELTDLEKSIESNCRKHIDMLAAQIGERHFALPHKLAESVDYLRNELTACGYNVEAHEFRLPEGTGTNLVATLPGRSRRMFVIGAHYDSIPGCAGANDNASGTAAVLELGRLLAGNPLDMTLRFVLFANEEHVGTPAEHMGSYLYARHCHAVGDEIAGMWSLETIGYFSEEKDSQHYPSPLDVFYPTTGNFIGFIGNELSSHWIRSSVRAFRQVAEVPSQGIAAPITFKDVDRSDHWGFCQFGYPALMVTDTANFRYPHYHTAGDTADRVNYEQLARLITGLAATIRMITRAR
jgi:hypothetical protein